MPSISPAEIRKQLDLILRSAEFAGGGNSREKPKIAALLNYLVEEYLEGRGPDEHTVGIRVFGRSKNWITQDDRIVSTNLRNLRDSLDVYYGTEGLHDPVHIRFPKGSGCRAAISHTRRSPADIEYRRGLHNLRSHAPQDLQNAIEFFQAAIAADAHHAAAYAQLAGALCELSWCLFDRRPTEVLLPAEQAATRAMELAPDAWISHVASGIIHISFHRWEAAKHAFDEALARDEAATRDHPWFYNLLDVTGDFGKALEKSALEVEIFPEDVYRALTHVFSLYFARRFDEAEILCRETLRLDRYSFRGHGAMYLISISAGKIEQALLHANELHNLAQMEVFPGLVALCHARLGDTRRASDILQNIEAQSRTAYVMKFHWCAAYMGIGDLDAAVRMLEGACEDYDPWMKYLHLMPFFDPLRGSTRFQALLQRMRLPRTQPAAR